MGNGFSLGKSNKYKRGASLVTTLVILSFVAILGFMTLSVAILNSAMRSQNLASDKNFYKVEKAVDEVMAGIGRDASDRLSESYASALADSKEPGNRESSSADTANAAANRKLRNDFVWSFLNQTDSGAPAADTFNSSLFTAMPDPDSEGNTIYHLKDAETQKTAGAALGKALKSYYHQDIIAKDTAPADAEDSEKSDAPEDLTLEVGDVYLYPDGALDASLEGDSSISFRKIVLKDTAFTYTDHNRRVQSSVTLDITLDIPTLRFADRAGVLWDYALISNKDISITRGNNTIDGSVYADHIALPSFAKVSVYAPLVTAAEGISLRDQSELSLNKAQTGAGSSAVNPDQSGTRLWTDSITLSSGSKLTASKADLYVRNDLILNEDQDKVTLSGSYIGYGSDSASEENTNSAQKAASSIVINGKNSLLDLSGLGSLILGGQAYVKLGDSASSGGAVYPLSESIAVRAAQAVYLVPAEDLELSDGTAPSGNPMDASEAGAGDTIRYIPSLDGYSSDACTVSTGTAVAGTGSPIYAYTTGDKTYVFRNFLNEEERSRYLQDYLTNVENANTFNDLLETQFAAAPESSGENPLTSHTKASELGIRIGKTADSSNRVIRTRGELYRVYDSTVSDADSGLSFDLVSMENSRFTGRNSFTGSTTDGTSGAITWADLQKSLLNRFETIQATLTPGGEKGASGTANLPLSSILSDTITPAATKSAGSAVIPGKVIAAATNVTVALNGTDAVISGAGEGNGTYDTAQDAVLLITTGDVTVTGSGTFNGTIAAFGDITIRSDTTDEKKSFVRPNKTSFNFDSDHLLDAGEGGAATKELLSDFRDYDGDTGAAPEDYTDWVKPGNWRRSLHRISGS